MSLKKIYNDEIKGKLQKELGVKNVMATPRLQKIVINVGAGEANANKNVLGKVTDQLALIAGQKAVETKARVSVSAFKIRKGLPIGAKVTLRGDNMYVFLEKLITIVIPRIRDFRGIAHSCVDSHGNLNIGFTEQTLFPEVDFDKIDKIRGLQVTLVSSAKTHEQGKELFKLFGIPFKA